MKCYLFTCSSLILLHFCLLYIVCVRSWISSHLAASVLLLLPLLPVSSSQRNSIHNAHLTFLNGVVVVVVGGGWLLLLLSLLLPSLLSSFKNWTCNLQTTHTRTHNLLYLLLIIMMWILLFLFLVSPPHQVLSLPTVSVK